MRGSPANAGTCGPGSLIGTATVAAGAGEDPVHVERQGLPDGPYKGAPFGLASSCPPMAGPFNLGVVVVRAAIQVDPNTAALTITSDPLPQIRRWGAVADQSASNVAIDRAGFTFNPTNCAPQQITATVTGRRARRLTSRARSSGGLCEPAVRPLLHGVHAGRDQQSRVVRA